MTTKQLFKLFLKVFGVIFLLTVLVGVGAAVAVRAYPGSAERLISQSRQVALQMQHDRSDVKKKSRSQVGPGELLLWGAATLTCALLFFSLANRIHIAFGAREDKS